MTSERWSSGTSAIPPASSNSPSTPRTDFAVGCTYKYLNGGPGAPAFICVARRLLALARNPLSGWWGHAAPFAFERDFRPDPGIKRFLCGTQPVLSLRGVEAALDALDGVAVADLRAKSLALTELFMARAEALLPELAIVTPRAPRCAAARSRSGIPRATRSCRR